MPLAEVVEAVRDALEVIPDCLVPRRPLPQRLTDKSLVVFPEPGDATPRMNRGPAGGIIYEARDFVIVEYHRVIAEKEFGSVEGDTTDMTDTLRRLVFAEFGPGGGAFAGTVELLHGVMRRKFGELGWNEFTFGVRLALDVSHHCEIGG